MDRHSKERQSRRSDAWRALVLTVIFIGDPGVKAQNSELRQRLADLQQAAALNRQMLGKYTWLQQVTISVKGEQKKQGHFRVQLGPNGQLQKTSLDALSPSESSGREGRLKKHFIQKKKEEYEEYANQIKSLIEQYVPPDREMLQQAFDRGNVMVGRTGSPGEYRIVIANYIKQGDNVDLIIDKAEKDLANLSIVTYLSDATDAVNVLVQFSRLPDGPNHVSTETINGVSKHLTITIENTNYQKL
jgi:hypothetical protein